MIDDRLYLFSMNGFNEKERRQFTCAILRILYIYMRLFVR